MYSPVELREMAEHLLDLADRIGPEGEGMDVLDEDFTIDELVQLRSKLSSMRKAIDVVNKALAKYWHDQYTGQTHDTEYDTWYVTQRKGKRAWDDTLFFDWLASKDATELSKLVSVSAVKVSGMSPSERETLLDESPTSETVSIESRPRR